MQQESLDFPRSNFGSSLLIFATRLAASFGGSGEADRLPDAHHRIACYQAGMVSIFLKP
jgi:hypothetical protein